MFDLVDSEWFVLFAVLVTSFAVCAGLILTTRWHGWLSLDHDLTGTQKFHERPVPRVGGIGVTFGLLAGAVGFAIVTDTGTHQEAALLVLCGAPAFAAGLLEDMTKRVSVSARLLATFVSAALAAWLLDAQLTRLDTPGLDQLMTFAPVAILFTCFAVGGVANAVNIIDGFNGLAAGSVALMLFGLAGLAFIYEDQLVVQLCLLGAFALLGFLVLNFPMGKIFLGDGGAYLAGFWLAECTVLLLARNPDISTWAPLLICIYPVWETFFSMWRKSIYRKTGSGKPDRVHFHMLVFRRFVGQRISKERPAWVRHAATTMFIWSLVAGCQVYSIVALLNNQGSWTYALGVAAFAVIYGHIYKSMVKGRRSPIELSANPAGAGL